MRPLVRNSGIRKWTFSVASAIAALSGFADPLLAQTRARLPGESKVMWQWVIAGAIALLCIVTAFINPKRSHRN